MLESIYHFDWNVFQFIDQNLQNPFMDVIMKLITISGNKGIVFIFIGFVLFCIGFFKKNETYKKIAVTMAFAVILIEVCNAIIVKELITRPRPFNFDWSQFSWAGQFVYPDLIAKPDSFSFPSGHSAVAFACSTAMIFYNKKWGAGLYIFSVLMAFSRVYAHVHYCTDVLGGAVFGIIYGLIAVLLAKLIYDIINNAIIMKIQNKIVK